MGALSSATISFVYKASSFRMDETHAMMWGCGQTVVHASFGITRILATLWTCRFQYYQSKEDDDAQERVTRKENVLLTEPNKEKKREDWDEEIFICEKKLYISYNMSLKYYLFICLFNNLFVFEMLFLVNWWSNWRSNTGTYNVKL